MVKALLLAVWHDLSDVKPAEALEDRASFRRFCGFSCTEPTPERTAFVRFRRTTRVVCSPTAPLAGRIFGDAVRARGGRPRVVVTAVWARDQEEADAKLDAWNAPIHRVRARIEKIFGTWKRSYGLRRMRWRGLARAAAQVHFTATASTLERCLNILSARRD